MNYLAGKAVLLVDDEPSVREAISLLLGCLGGVVTEAGTGDEAIALFAPDRFALVVTDYTMPGMNGAALAEAIRQRDPNQRIIMISGYAEQLRRGGKLPPAIGALLPKPCSLAALEEGLRSVGFSHGAGSPAS
jgi:two-component system cell cycle sensor histidine kinase/response regulator CckA